MAQSLKISSCILMCTYLLAMASGDTLSCCRRDFFNGSSSYELSARPDPSCDTLWIADGVSVVDEAGGVDGVRVHHAASQSIILRQKHTRVIFLMDCPSKDSLEVYCNDPCESSDESSPATEESQHTGRPKNAADRSPSHDIFIVLVIIIIFTWVT